MSWFSNITRSVGRAVRAAAGPVAAGALAIPGVGPLLAPAINWAGRTVGTAMAGSDNSVQTRDNAAGALGQAIATGYTESRAGHQMVDGRTNAEVGFLERYGGLLAAGGLGYFLLNRKPGRRR